MSKVYPVIHHLNVNLSVEQAKVAKDAGADGVFLISHHGKNMELCEVRKILKTELPLFRVGFNFLGWDSCRAHYITGYHGGDMLWLDAPGINGNTISDDALKLLKSESDLFSITARRFPIFASVAFKYQPIDEKPASAAKLARAVGWIPTTSGTATGSPPTIDKIKSMFVSHETLAVASGMTPENVGDYKHFLSHILVSTGVSINDYQFDYEKLRIFIAKAK